MWFAVGSFYGLWKISTAKNRVQCVNVCTCSSHRHYINWCCCMFVSEINEISSQTKLNERKMQSKHFSMMENKLCASAVVQNNALSQPFCTSILIKFHNSNRKKTLLANELHCLFSMSLCQFQLQNLPFLVNLKSIWYFYSNLLYFSQLCDSN